LNVLNLLQSKNFLGLLEVELVLVQVGAHE
jgi:hypothetical protein